MPNTLPTNGNGRDRVNFSKIKTTIPIPNLIEVQKRSYERFLQIYTAPADREDIGLQAVFKSIFPISDFRQTCSLEFVEYTIGNWECKCGKLDGLAHLRITCVKCGKKTISQNTKSPRFNSRLGITIEGPKIDHNIRTISPIDDVCGCFNLKSCIVKGYGNLVFI